MKDYLKNGLDLINIEYNDEQINLLIEFMKIILIENKKINLTAITNEKEFIEKHLIDCAISTKYIDKGKVIDIGSGAGMPGIIIKILRDDLDILLIDALGKRINILNKVIKELGLLNIFAMHERAEELSRNLSYREQFDYAISRAVAGLEMLAELSLPFIKIGGEFIALKGNKATEEVASSKKAFKILGGDIPKINELTLPYSKANRSIVISKKISKTIDKYPRSFKKIKKGF